MVGFGCQQRITDPAATLADSGTSNSTHQKALRLIMSQPDQTPSDLDALQGLVYRPGYDSALRLEGMNYLLHVDRQLLLTTLRRRLPRITDHDWLRDVCRFVAQHDLVELDEALVSSWGRPWSGGMSETDRPEYLALRAMQGPDGTTQAVWKAFEASTKPSQQGLRARCWELLHRLGYRERLIDLVLEPPATHHPMLVDLHAAAVSFGTIPWNREELLWVSRLSSPERADFWRAATSAV